MSDVNPTLSILILNGNGHSNKKAEITEWMKKKTMMRLYNIYKRATFDLKKQVKRIKIEKI